MPTLSYADTATKAEIELKDALNNPTPTAQFETTNQDTMKALDNLAKHFTASASSMSIHIQGCRQIKKSLQG